MKRTIVVSAIVILLVASFGWVVWGVWMSRVEQPKYTVEASSNGIEIRTYEPMLIAQVTVEGEREEAIRNGFRQIADYIFGDNQASDKIAMTSPVTQQADEKIAMTAPVVQQQSEKIAMTAPVVQQQGEKIAMAAPVSQQPHANFWTVHFVMPAKYTMQTLPKPNNNAIHIIPRPARKVAVIRFSGSITNQSLVHHQQRLFAYLDKYNIKAISAPAYAFYNPPSTPPFLRRNEVMVDIED